MFLKISFDITVTFVESSVESFVYIHIDAGMKHNNIP